MRHCAIFASTGGGDASTGLAADGASNELDTWLFA
jgi:hypothetical protein